VFDPNALYELFPDKKETWTQELFDATGSYATPVLTDEFRILSNDQSSYTIPHLLLPPQLHNHGNYIISLSQLTRWLAGLAEQEYGVEIFPGFAAASLLYNDTETAVMGVTTRDVGVAKDGTVKDTYEPGVKLVARHTILAEGARGSCSEALMDKFNLRQDCQPQTYGLGIKEVWQIPSEQHRNAHAAFAQFGVAGGLVHAGFTAHITKGREPWTLSGHAGGDSTTTEPADQHRPIDYPPPDHKLTFDLLTNLQRSGTYHAEDQPCHLRIKPHVDIGPSLAVYAGPEQRFCPAGVYEYVDNDDDNGNDGAAADGQKKKKLVINSQNCIHCKCCSIKMPNDYIDWTVPEGSGGPQYRNM
jgi:NAD-dependent dihydropyrimidine dehydrogenase PreA subunit